MYHSFRVCGQTKSEYFFFFASEKSESLLVGGGLFSEIDSYLPPCHQVVVKPGKFIFILRIVVFLVGCLSQLTWNAINMYIGQHDKHNHNFEFVIIHRVDL